MPDVRGLLADPEFNALPMERRQAILARINPQLAQEYGAQQPQAASQGGWEAVRRTFFDSGSQERAEALDTVMSGVDAFAGGGVAQGAGAVSRAAVAGARALPGILGRSVNWAAQHPKTAGAIADAAPELLQGNVEGALWDAARGAALGAAAQGAGKVVRRVRGTKDAIDDVAAAIPKPTEPVVMLNPQGKRIVVHQDIAQKLHGEGWTMAPAAAPRVTTPPPVKARPVPEQSATTPTQAPVDRGRAAATAHSEMVALAKEAVQKNPGAGWGSKIWIRFKDGKPVGVIPSYEDGHHAQDMAAAINRRTKKTGEKAVFIRNLWGDARHLSASLE